MKAQLFDEIFLHIKCQRLAAAALAEACRPDFFPVCPSGSRVREVIQGTRTLLIHRNGALCFTTSSRR